MHLLTSSLLLSLAIQGSADERSQPDPDSTPQRVQAVRLSQPIAVDGVLDEAAWQGATPFTDFTQRDPDEGGEPSQRTEVYVMYDDNGLYIGARLYDTGADSIVARLGRRDVWTNSDWFAVFLDPYRDGRTGFYFGLNAAGTQYDGVLFNDDWDDDNWDGVWDGSVERTADGWTAEMRIPYSQLRFKNGTEQIWGINFKREIARNNETDYLVFTPKNESGFVSRFPVLFGLEGVNPPRRLEILPYVTSRAALTDQEAGNPFNDGSQFTSNVGADVKFGLGSNLTIDATINPDFGQVEVDPAVVNLSDFETFFPEKRPFFIEGRTIFDFGFGGANSNWGFNFGTPDFFYSRRVGRSPQGSLPDADYTDTPDGTTILGAAKISGKVGSTNIGMMHALTGREMADIDLSGVQDAVEVEPRTYYGVARAQREMNDGRQALGFIATYAKRDFGDPRLVDEINSSSLALGLDGWTFLDEDKTWVITGWAGASRVAGSTARILDVQQNFLHRFQRPDASHVEVDSSRTSLGGYAGRVALNKQKGDWRINSAFGVISPGFDVNDVGFQWNSDIVNGHFVLSRRWTQPGPVFRSVFSNIAAFRSWNFDGDVTWTGLWQNSSFQFLNYYRLRYFVAYNPQTVSFRRTRGGPLTINPAGWEGDVTMSSDDRKSLVFGLGFRRSDYQQDSDKSWRIRTEVEWKPTSSLSLSFEPSLSRSFTAAQYVDTFEDPTATATFGNRYVFADLQRTTLSGGLRLNWVFTPKLSLQVYAQPLIASGDYANYKELARPRSYDFNVYGQSGTSTFDDETFTADPDGPAGPAQPLEIGNLDFNFRSLRGNAVLRWEYMPGSTLFLVWTQSRTDDETIGDFRFGRSLSRLFSAKADNIFAIKMTYWWNP
ncbi:MAG: carbohydrate binding family 9 domain-containing protein [Gemmatimonadales bacterium]|nr:carbohydrate binding family 9 domain-containing protein [Gemmatimonadales bacterium]